MKTHCRFTFSLFFFFRCGYIFNRPLKGSFSRVHTPTPLSTLSAAVLCFSILLSRTGGGKANRVARERGNKSLWENMFFWIRGADHCLAICSIRDSMKILSHRPRVTNYIESAALWLLDFNNLTANSIFKVFVPLSVVFNFIAIFFS